MIYSDTDLQRNSIVKKLGVLLPQIDPRVEWVDYIPNTAIKTDRALIAVSMKNGDVKYVDITKKSPFRLVNEVLNAMDDYRLETQFLNSKQLKAISGDIEQLAKDRKCTTNEVFSALEKEVFSNDDCLDIVKRAQDLNIFPRFFPKTDKSITITSAMLEDFLKTTKVTFLDLQILSDLIEEKKLHNNEQDINNYPCVDL